MVCHPWTLDSVLPDGMTGHLPVLWLKMRIAARQVCMTNKIPSKMPTPLRIFLASPGDVSQERQLALKVLDELPYDPAFRDKISVQTVAWDKPGAGTPMLAGMTPQQAIAEGLP